MEVMLPEERKDPSLLVEDLKEGSATPGPRLQRLAKASGQPETEVAMLVMQVLHLLICSFSVCVLVCLAVVMMGCPGPGFVAHVDAHSLSS